MAVVLAALCAPAGAAATTWLRPLFLKGPSYSESFTFVADLDDGSYVQLSLAVTNLGPGWTKGVCRALVVAPQGAPWKASARFSRDELRWADGDRETLSVGTCSAWVEGAASGIEVALEGGAVRLAFSGRVALQPAPDPLVRVGDDRYQNEVLLYRAPVSASVALPGQPSRTTSGAGYLDHTRSTVPPKDLASRWVRFRALRGRVGLLLLGREGRDGRFEPLWACEGQAPCRSYQSFQLLRGGTGKSPSFRVDLLGEAPLEILSGHLLYRDAPIEDLGVAGKLVQPFIGSPVTYVYRASATDDARARIDGILEVELSGE